jgi:hypothetical protein
LSAHEKDGSLLPPDAGHTMEKRQYITCYDPSTAVSLILTLGLYVSLDDELIV